MFEQGGLLFIIHLLLNIFLGLIVGIMSVFFIFGNKFKGLELYFLGRFFGIGIVGLMIFNFQIISFGNLLIQYFIFLIMLFFITLIKIYLNKEKIFDYINSLKLNININHFFIIFLKLNIFEKILGILCITFVVSFLSLSFINNIVSPSFYDDAFANWNQKGVNIFYDGGIKISGNQDEILGGGRLQYPIMLSTYKALVSSFVGEWNEYYSSLLHYLIFLFGVFFVFWLNFSYTKNILISLSGIVLICGLPLTYFHVVDSYMDLPCAIYCILIIFYFLKYIENKDFNNFLIGVLFLILLSFIKNDGIIVYGPGIILAFLIIIILKKQLINFIKSLFQITNLLKLLLFVLFLFIPFNLIKLTNGQGFNPIGNEEKLISDEIHFEIFNTYYHIFFNQNTYNIILFFVFIVILKFFIDGGFKNQNKLFILLSFIFIFSIFTLTFLLTSNYKWVLDQTTVNRVFTMCFIILCGFSGFLLNKN